jgi:DNA polymerase III subunit epsilon
MVPDKLAFLDVETTGGNPSYDRIIEIGIVRVEKGKIKKTYQSLVDSQTHLPPEITNLTGITEKHLQRYPSFREQKDDIDEMLGGSVIVAHNAQFDVGFLKSEYSRLGDTFSAKHICTAKLSRLMFPHYKRHNLDSIIERFNIKCEPRHRAYPDALALWDFFQILINQFDKEKLIKAVDQLLKKPSLPKGIDEKVIQKLPDGPGVYIFYNKEGAPLYVGKSIHIKERVMSHFYANYKNTREFEIAQLVSHIEAQNTEGELAALLTEKSLIRKIQPLYNRTLRDSRKLLVVLRKVTPEGYLTVTTKNSDHITYDEIAEILAVFKTTGHFKRTLLPLAKEYSLCHKLLGLENGKGKCFGCQIEQCFGACVKEESPIKYNLRFDEAFSKTRVKSWPFPGPIVIPEGTKGHLVNRWCYLGEIVESEQYSKDLFAETQFDYDTYKILSNYLLNPKNSSRVKLID